MMRPNFLLVALLFTATTVMSQEKKTNAPVIGGTISLSKEALKDKIKGGWAGQTVGVTFGGPY